MDAHLRERILRDINMKKKNGQVCESSLCSWAGSPAIPSFQGCAQGVWASSGLLATLPACDAYLNWAGIEFRNISLASVSYLGSARK